MALNQILDSIYIIPMLLDHLDEPTSTTEMFLAEQGISKKDIEECSKIKSLLEYHMRFIQNKSENYPLLRKGLDEYFKLKLKDIFIHAGISTETPLHMLDYACGSGCYSDEFIKLNPSNIVMAVDKDLLSFDCNDKRIFAQAVDFEKEPDWYFPYIGLFDVVLLSEILHCKDRKQQEYLIHSSYSMLKEGGRIIINENIDYAMQYRISKLKNQLRPVLQPDEVIKLVNPNVFDIAVTTLKTINKHHIYVFKKV